MAIIQMTAAGGRRPGAALLVSLSGVVGGVDGDCIESNRFVQKTSDTSIRVRPPLAV
jgi:hypothetical protein